MDFLVTTHRLVILPMMASVELAVAVLQREHTEANRVGTCHTFAESHNEIFRWKAHQLILVEEIKRFPAASLRRRSTLRVTGSIF